MSYTTNKNWLSKNCEKEDYLDVSAGSLDFSTVKFKKPTTTKSSKQCAHKVSATISAHHKKRTRKAS